jgi:hypothetical protein
MIKVRLIGSQEEIEAYIEWLEAQGLTILSKSVLYPCHGSIKLKRCYIEL